MSPGLNQLEFRWTDEGQRGYSVTAYSGSSEPDLWERRLRLARPPKIQQQTTVVFEIFGQEAVILFRHVLPSAAPGASGPGYTGSGDISAPPAREALVARALVGPAEHLTPELALACAYLRLPKSLVPSVGKAERGQRLPLLQLEKLQAEAQAVVPELDERARRDPALPYLVAAALANPATPMIVQMPPDEVGLESTAALLWGLFNITVSLLGKSWTWTFSTGEPPPGNIDTRVLPHLVVRALPRPDDPPSTAQRSETVVTPRDLDPAPRNYNQDVVSELLVAAYRDLPVDDFERRLSKIGTAHTTVSARLRAATEEFRGRSTAQLQPPSPAQEPVDVRRSGGGTSSAVSTSGQHAGTWVPPVPQAPRLLDTHHSVDKFSRLFQQLANNDEAAPDDLRDMAERDEPPDQHRRAALRNVAAQHGWFVRQFVSRHPREVDDCLAALFTLIVEPDMNDDACRPGLLDEITDWIQDESTPPTVILALEELFYSRGDHEFHKRLRYVAGPRWLADRGRYGRLSELARTLPQPEMPAPTGAWWLPFGRKDMRALAANILLYLLIVETAVLAVLVAARS